MPRLVRLSGQGPVKIEPSDKPIWVCACGLSQRFPICDGAHKACRGTEPDATALYVYDDERKSIVDVRPDSGTGQAPQPGTPS